MSNIDPTHVEISENPIFDKDGKRIGTIAVLRGGVGLSNPTPFMDQIVCEYAEERLHNQFVEYHKPGSPWTRIVIDCINELDYVDFKSQRLKNNYEEEIDDEDKLN